jgi:hypothetical protein
MWLCGGNNQQNDWSGLLRQAIVGVGIASLGSSFSIVTRLCAGRCGVRISVVTGEFYLFRCVETGSEATGLPN